jgi:O-antigen/teichoic acid export membrane protein
MLLKLKKIISTDLVKVSFLNGLATLVRMLTGLISVKVVAVKLHLSGIALLGQLNNFTQILLSISSGGINNGIVKNISQDIEAERRYKIFISTGVRITLTIGSVLGLVSIIGAPFFSRFILDDSSYTGVFIIFGLTIILYALNALLLSVINGFREFKKYILVNIANSVAGLVFAVVLTYSFGLYGALIGAVTYQSIVFAISLSMVTRAPWFKWSLFTGPFSKAAALKLGRYSLMALVSAVAIPFAQFVIRSFLIKYQGKDDAGAWEGMNRISGIYLMVITTSLSVYYLPKLSGLKTDREIRAEVFTVYKLLIPTLVLISFGIFIFRGPIVNILYEPSFRDKMRDLFAFQMIGDVLKMSTWVLGYILVAKSMARAYIVVEIVSCTLFALFSMLFVHLYGTIGATIGYAAAFLCQLLIMVFIFRKLLFGK